MFEATLAPCVLVVDDCRETTASLSILAQLWGHRVHVANDAAEAIQMAAEYQPETVFVGIDRPDRAGWELARQLRELPGLEGAVLVTLSCCARAGDQLSLDQLSLGAGCDLHLTKPVEAERLRQLLAVRERGGYR